MSIQADLPSRVPRVSSGFTGHPVLPLVHRSTPLAPELSQSTFHGLAWPGCQCTRQTSYRKVHLSPLRYCGKQSHGTDCAFLQWRRSVDKRTTELHASTTGHLLSLELNLKNLLHASTCFCGTHTRQVKIERFALKCRLCNELQPLSGNCCTVPTPALTQDNPRC